MCELEMLTALTDKTCLSWGMGRGGNLMRLWALFTVAIVHSMYPLPPGNSQGCPLGM
jgi:hypothetical protein